MNEPDPKQDNSGGTIEPEGEMAPEEDNVTTRIDALESKIATLSQRHAEQMRGAKAEVDKYKAQVEQLQTASQSDSRPDSQLSDQELFDKYAGNSKAIQNAIDKIRIDNYNSKRDEEKDKFLDAHPEYKPENDKDNSKWNALIGEISTYKAPANASDWGKLLKKAHNAIQPNNDLEKGKALGMAQANLAQQAKLGGGSSVSTERKKRTPEQEAAREEFKKARPEYFE